MPNPRYAALIAAKLPTLTHPGDGDGPMALPVSAFRTANLPPQVAEQFAQEAGLPHSDIPKLFAEAIVAAVEDAGGTIIDRADLERLQSAAAPVDESRQLPIHCHCGARLFTVQVLDLNTSRPRVYGPQLVRDVRRLGDDCATGHRS